MLREVKPRNARTARIVKAREPQSIESRKKILFLHGTKCSNPLQTVLRTFTSLTRPHNVVLNKKNENIHPFENTSSLEFLADKNECGVVVFASHSKKRPHTATILRTFDNKALDLVELLLLNADAEADFTNKLQIPVEMKPLILFAGSQWDDASSNPIATLFRTLKSIFLDLFSGEETSSVDVAGLQYFLVIASGEQPPTSESLTTSTTTTTLSPSQLPVLHLRWYKLRTLRSTNPKIPRVELDPMGPSLDFRVGRYREADDSMMKEALKRAKLPTDTKTKKNVETDLMGDKMGRVHLGKQDLSGLQTRKMKGLKRSRDDEDDIGDDVAVVNGDTNGMMDVDDISVDEDYTSDEDEGGMAVNGRHGGDDDLEDVEFVDEDDSGDDEMNGGEEEELSRELPKRQKIS